MLPPPRRPSIVLCSVHLSIPQRLLPARTILLPYMLVKVRNPLCQSSHGSTPAPLTHRYLPRSAQETRTASTLSPPTPRKEERQRCSRAATTDKLRCQTNARKHPHRQTQLPLPSSPQNDGGKRHTQTPHTHNTVHLHLPHPFLQHSTRVDSTPQAPQAPQAQHSASSPLSPPSHTIK